MKESELLPPPTHSCPNKDRTDMKGFHTPQTKLTASAHNGLRERDASESMEVLSTQTIGSSAQRARVQGG